MNFSPTTSFSNRQQGETIVHNLLELLQQFELAYNLAPELSFTEIIELHDKLMELEAHLVNR